MQYNISDQEVDPEWALGAWRETWIQTQSWII